MDKEYILCAANYYDDGIEHHHQPNFSSLGEDIKTGFVVCGRRHHNCITTFAMIVGFPYNERGLEIMRTEEQGFLTNTNRFVSRLEALRIAKEANQLLPDERINESIGLYSENLY